MTTLENKKAFARRFDDAIHKAAPGLNEMFNHVVSRDFNPHSDLDFLKVFKLLYKGTYPDIKTVGRWRTGKSIPQETFRPRICELLSVSWRDLELGYMNPRTASNYSSGIEIEQELRAYPRLTASLQIDPAIEHLPPPVRETVKQQIDGVNALIKVLIEQQRPD